MGSVSETSRQQTSGNGQNDNGEQWRADRKAGVIRRGQTDNEWTVGEQ